MLRRILRAVIRCLPAGMPFAALLLPIGLLCSGCVTAALWDDQHSAIARLDQRHRAMPELTAVCALDEGHLGVVFSVPESHGQWVTLDTVKLEPVAAGADPGRRSAEVFILPWQGNFVSPPQDPDPQRWFAAAAKGRRLDWHFVAPGATCVELPTGPPDAGGRVVLRITHADDTERWSGPRTCVARALVTPFTAVVDVFCVGFYAWAIMNGAKPDFSSP